MLVCGVDEAGRGPMLGPMVVAGVAVSKSGARALKRAGVRDSKKLSPKARSRLYREILRIADAYTISRIQPHTIDRSVQRRGLNDLEASSMARIVSRLGADVSYVDSCDTDSARFGKKVSRLAGGKKVRSYHKADDRFAVVAAASILAKVSRDRAVARLGSVGSGYPADQHTRSHVRSYIKRHGSAPPYARKSWKPVKKMLERP